MAPEVMLKCVCMYIYLHTHTHTNRTRPHTHTHTHTHIHTYTHTHTHTHNNQGTANWMAPEVILSENPGRAADIWSLGMLHMTSLLIYEIYIYI